MRLPWCLLDSLILSSSGLLDVLIVRFGEVRTCCAFKGCGRSVDQA